MKKFLFLGVMFFLVACSKAPAPAEGDNAPAADEAAVVEASAASTEPAELADCKQLAVALASCAPATCSSKMDMFGTQIDNIFTVIGADNGFCKYSTSMGAEFDGKYQEEVTMRCMFPPDKQNEAAKYLETYFNSDGNISVKAEITLSGVVETEETIDGKKVNNPFTDYLKDGTCIVPGMPEDGSLSCVGNGTMTVVTKDENGNDIETIIECTPESGPDSIPADLAESEEYIE